jgi:hypothetical protein
VELKEEKQSLSSGLTFSSLADKAIASLNKNFMKLYKYSLFQRKLAFHQNAG